MMKKMKIDVRFVVLGVLIFAFVMAFTFAKGEPAMAVGKVDPLAGFHFALEIQGVVQSYFTEARNIGSEHEIVETKVTGDRGQQSVRKIPGRLKFLDITLRRGITSNMDLQIWRKMVVDGYIDNARKDGSIVMYDQSMKEVARWNFTRGWPSKFVSNPVDAYGTNVDANAISIESVTITVESIQRVK